LEWQVEDAAKVVEPARYDIWERLGLGDGAEPPLADAILPALLDIK